MEIQLIMQRLGHVADARTLLRYTTRGRIRGALRRGEIVRVARGGYALPMAPAGVRAALRLSGAQSHASAAWAWGWETKLPVDLPHVTVPRNRRIAPHRRRGVQVHWLDLSAEELSRGRTGAVRTVLDCAKTMPFDEAVAIADSALRHRSTSQEELIRAADQVPTTGREQCLRVAHEATPLAANPFESGMRAIAGGVPGLEAVPQLPVLLEGQLYHPDLADERRRIVIEAESFEFHASRSELARDCLRYTRFAMHGWVVVRFTWHQVMYDPAWVEAALRRVLTLRPPEHAALPETGRRAA